MCHANIPSLYLIFVEQICIPKCRGNFWTIRRIRFFRVCSCTLLLFRCIASICMVIEFWSNYGVCRTTASIFLWCSAFVVLHSGHFLVFSSYNFDWASCFIHILLILKLQSYKNRVNRVCHTYPLSHLAHFFNNYAL